MAWSCGSGCFEVGSGEGDLLLVEPGVMPAVGEVEPRLVGGAEEGETQRRARRLSAPSGLDRHGGVELEVGSGIADVHLPDVVLHLGEGDRVDLLVDDGGVSAVPFGSNEGEKANDLRTVHERPPGGWGRMSEHNIVS